MTLKYLKVIMQIGGIGLVIAAAGLWASAGVAQRPKHTDEQTLIGGTIWSQIIIPIGLLISQVVEEKMDAFVQVYYLVAGVLLLWITGIDLIWHETRIYIRMQQRLRARTARSNTLEAHAPGKRTTSQQTSASIPYDKTYYTIGIICVLAGAVKMSELVVLVILSKAEGALIDGGGDMIS